MPQLKAVPVRDLGPSELGGVGGQVPGDVVPLVTEPHDVLRSQVPPHLVLVTKRVGVDLPVHVHDAVAKEANCSGLAGGNLFTTRYVTSNQS